ncbi:MAG: hypothetical protein K0S11_1412 [Gammaproteobacteria bacterium]|jgi:hypothetical protein|nr:hypothetical protein [Gammaproteobacteria bacterium]
MLDNQRQQSANETLPSQTGKSTQQPTMKWIYRLFQGVQVMTIQLGEITQTLHPLFKCSLYKIQVICKYNDPRSLLYKNING